MKPYLERVLGDTWCIVTGFARIPLYMPDRANAVMIDSGLKKPDRQGILDLLEEEKIRVSALLTSHFHLDHTGNHRAIRQVHNAEVYMTPYASVMSADERYRMTAALGYPMPMANRKISSGSVATQLFFPEEASVTAAGYSFPLLPLPGHAQEHTGFVTPDGVAYLGDTILSREVLHGIRLPYIFSCGEDLQAKESLLNLNYPCYILAHNAVCSELRELVRENVENLHEKLHIVERFAGKWITLEQLTAEVIRHTGADGETLVKVIGARRNVQTLASYLQETGRLEARARDGLVEYILRGE